MKCVACRGPVKNADGQPWLRKEVPRAGPHDSRLLGDVFGQLILVHVMDVACRRVAVG